MFSIWNNSYCWNVLNSIRFVAPEVKSDNEEVPETLGTLILQADWIYPSSIIPIILKVRLFSALYISTII